MLAGQTFSHVTLAIIPGGRDCYYPYVTDEEMDARWSNGATESQGSAPWADRSALVTGWRGERTSEVATLSLEGLARTG